MTTFINNAQEFLTGTPFSSTEDFFTDDNGSNHEDNINGVASEGIAQGIGGTLFNPSGLVSRDQMASFLIRYLTVLFNDGVIDELGGGDLASPSRHRGNGRAEPDRRPVLTFGSLEPGAGVDHARRRRQLRQPHRSPTTRRRRRRDPAPFDVIAKAPR